MHHQLQRLHRATYLVLIGPLAKRIIPGDEGTYRVAVLTEHRVGPGGRVGADGRRGRWDSFGWQARSLPVELRGHVEETVALASPVSMAPSRPIQAAAAWAMASVTEQVLDIEHERPVVGLGDFGETGHTGDDVLGVTVSAAEIIHHAVGQL